MGADHADFESRHGRVVGPDGQDHLRRLQQHADPVRAVDQPGRVQERLPRHAQAGGDPGEVRLGHGSRAGQRRRREGQPAAVALDPDQPGPALLDQHAVLPGDAAGLQPGVRRAEGGVAGKGELLAAGEDPDPVVGRGVRGRQQERGLGEVGPVGELLHRRPPGVPRRRRRRPADCPGRARRRKRPPARRAAGGAQVQGSRSPQQAITGAVAADKRCRGLRDCPHGCEQDPQQQPTTRPRQPARPSRSSWPPSSIPSAGRTASGCWI